MVNYIIGDKIECDFNVEKDNSYITSDEIVENIFKKPIITTSKLLFPP